MDIHQILKNVWLPPTTGLVSAELYIMTCCYIGCWEVADQAHFVTICPTFRHNRTQLFNHCATPDPNFYHSSLLLKIKFILCNDLTVKLILDRVYILFLIPRAKVEYLQHKLKSQNSCHKYLRASLLVFITMRFYVSSIPQFLNKE